MLTLPLLIFSGMSASVANGSNRIFMFVQSATAGVELWRQSPMSVKTAALWTLPTLVSALMGAYIATQIDSAQLKVGMGWLILASLFAVATKKLYFLWKKSRALKQEGQAIAGVSDESFKTVADEELFLDLELEGALGTAELPEGSESSLPPLTAGQVALNLAILFALGFYGGLIQAGLGAVLLAVLHKQCRLSKHNAMALKNIIIAFYTLPVLLLFFWKGQVAWLPGTVLAVGALIGAKLGALLANQISMPVLMAVIYVVMFLSGLSLIFA